MTSLVLPLDDESQVGFARRTAGRMAEAVGFGVREAGRVALVVTEVASNVIRHARFGHLFLRKLEEETARGIEILCVDSGPGFSVPGEVFSDGFSTSGGPGMGLGAIVRLSTESDFYSLPGKGLAVLSRVWNGKLPRGRFAVGAIAVPYPEERVCGDSWFAGESPSGMTLFLADGLGHGVRAAEASQAAVDVVREMKALFPSEIMGRIRDGIHQTRGAVGFLSQIDTQRRQVRYSGVGNIDARIVSAEGGQRHLVSRQGMLGNGAPLSGETREAVSEWSPRDCICMASDGIGVRWHPEDLPGLFSRHPALICGVLWREFSRGTDDASVLVCREQAVSG